MSNLAKLIAASVAFLVPLVVFAQAERPGINVWDIDAQGSLSATDVSNVTERWVGPLSECASAAVGEGDWEVAGRLSIQADGLVTDSGAVAVGGAEPLLVRCVEHAITEHGSFPTAAGATEVTLLVVFRLGSNIEAVEVEDSAPRIVASISYLGEAPDGGGGSVTGLYEVVGSDGSGPVDVGSGWDSLDPLSFLVGHWRAEGDGVLIEEIWHAPVDDHMLGLGRSIGETTFGERLVIEYRLGEIVYIATPEGQEPTEFLLVAVNGNEATFENPSHDFPQRIRYSRTNDTLRAVVEDLAGVRRLEFGWTLHADPPLEDVR